MKVGTVKFLVIFFSIVLLSACNMEQKQQKQLIFFGVSDNWSVRYEVNMIDDNSETKGLIIKYIGNGPIPKEVEYSVDSMSGSVTDILDKNGTFKMSGSGCDGCAITRENQEIEAIIEWGNQSEIIPLTTE